MPPVRIENGILIRDGIREAEDEERSHQPGTKANPEEQKRQEKKSKKPDDEN